MNQDEIEDIVEAEVARVEQSELLDVMRRHLVTPRLEQREWDYGPADQRFPCWIVWEHATSGTAIGYCVHGFGPAYPWGLLFLAPDSGLGMDCQWYLTLEEAVRESMAWDGENPEGYEVG